MIADAVVHQIVVLRMILTVYRLKGPSRSKMLLTNQEEQDSATSTCSLAWKQGECCGRAAIIVGHACNASTVNSKPFISYFFDIVIARSTSCSLEGVVAILNFEN